MLPNSKTHRGTPLEFGSHPVHWNPDFAMYWEVLFQH